MAAQLMFLLAVALGFVLGRYTSAFVFKSKPPFVGRTGGPTGYGGDDGGTQKPDAN